MQTELDLSNLFNESLPLSSLSNAGTSWLDISHEQYLKNSTSSISLLDTSLYLSFLRNQSFDDNLHFSNSYSEIEELGLTSLTDGNCPFKSENISQMIDCSYSSMSFINDLDDVTDVAHNTLIKNPVTSINVESSSIFLGKNPLNYYETLPTSLKGSGTSLNKFKSFFSSLKSASQKNYRTNFDTKAIRFESSSFLDDDFSIEMSKNPSRSSIADVLKPNVNLNTVNMPALQPIQNDISNIRNVLGSKSASLPNEKKKKKKSKKNSPLSSERHESSENQKKAMNYLMNDFEKSPKIDPFWKKFNPYKFFQRNIHDYIQETILNDDHGHVQVYRVYSSGISIKFYSNGTAKEKLPSDFKSSPELSELDSCLEGSIFYYLKEGLQKKQILANNDVIHYYLDTGITCIICAKTGTKTYRWPNGQLERYFSSTTSLPKISQTNEQPYSGLVHEIVYPDGTIYQRLQSGKSFFVKK